MKGHVIIKPIMTEKMHILQESVNAYAFQVDKAANKLEIKKSVEEKFGVRVKHVRTLNLRGKSRTMTVRSGGRAIRTQGRTANWKKAIVTLMPGETIDLYGGEIA